MRTLRGMSRDFEGYEWGDVEGFDFRIQEV